MKFIGISTLLLAWFLQDIDVVLAARILFLIPVPSYSHQAVYRQLVLGLSQRGHDVVYVTTHPIADSALPNNVRQIELNITRRVMSEIELQQLRYTSGDTWTGNIFERCDISSRLVYENPEIMRLYALGSDETFDLLMTETLCTPAIYALAYRFRVPIVGLASMGLSIMSQYHYGLPLLSSHPSTWEMEMSGTPDLSFLSRLRNFIAMWMHFYRWRTYSLPLQQNLAYEYLGPDVPDLNDIARNISLTFVAQQDLISYVRPTLPHIITFGGLHISKDLVPLPDGLQTFVDEAPNGFVYFSLGTSVGANKLPERILTIFLEALADLPYRVVWKYEGYLPLKPQNIYVDKWFPQQTLLGHPKLRAYVYQGGLQSTEEAIHYGVPIVGVPVFFDQYATIDRMVALGVGKRVEIFEMTLESFADDIIEVAENERYRQNALRVRKLLNDKPYDTLGQLIWWTEYVIRHKGAPHLHCSTAKEPLHQRYDQDVLAFLVVALFITFLLLLVIACKICACLWYKRRERLLNDKKKIT